MKIFLIAIGALAVSTVSFADERLYYIADGKRTANFDTALFKKITGEFVNSEQSDRGWHTNSITITKDGVIKAQVASQVGRDKDTRFPYETDCMLIYSGKIKNFYTVDSERRKYYRDNGKSEPSLHIEMAGPHLELVKNKGNSERCPDYITENNTVSPRTWFWTEFYLDGDSIVEPWGPDTFKRVRR